MAKKIKSQQDTPDSSEEKLQTEEDFKQEILNNISKILVEVAETRKDIESSVTPKFLEVSPQVKDLIELSIEIWRLESRLNKILPTLQENQKETITNSVQKIKRYLEKNDIGLEDYTNHKFNEGRNLDILAVEKDSKIVEPIIKETKEPTVLFKGQVVRKGKVIILEGENKKEEGGQNEQ